MSITKNDYIIIPVDIDGYSSCDSTMSDLSLSSSSTYDSENDLDNYSWLGSIYDYINTVIDNHSKHKSRVSMI